MPNHDILTDEYVAGLLADEANGYALRYSTMGMDKEKVSVFPPATRGGILANPSSRPANKPKPNTRFLRHIIQGTDSHNRALLAKEAAVSKARLDDLEKADEARRLKTNPNANDIRKRQIGDIHAILGNRNGTSDQGYARSSHGRKKVESAYRDRNRAVWENDLRGLKGSRDGHRHGRIGERDPKKRDHGPGKQDKKRSRRDASLSGEDDGRRQGRSRRGGSESPRRHQRSRSPRKEKRSYRERSRQRSRQRSRRRSRRCSPSRDVTGPSRVTASETADDDDSDPLNDLIGPAPPPRYRGRGTIGGAASLDRRFSPSYDPRTDTRDGDDMQEDAWDDAVETYRDLHKLRQNQSQRMRAAGFPEEQIRDVEEDGEEQTATGVVWTKTGEKRAWDQGKASDEEAVHPPTLFSEHA